MEIDKKQDFISVDGKTAISSYGEYFTVGEKVGHQDSEAGEATIISFNPILSENEITVWTDKGNCHLDFLVKLEKHGI